jgi:hypothetical protein
MNTHVGRTVFCAARVLSRNYAISFPKTCTFLRLYSVVVFLLATPSVTERTARKISSVIDILGQHLPGGTEEIQGSHCEGRYLNRVSSECNSRASQLDQTVHLSKSPVT